MSIQVALIIVELLIIGGLIGAVIMSLIYNPYGTAEYHFKSYGLTVYQLGDNYMKIYYDNHRKSLYLQLDENTPIRLRLDDRDKAGHSYRIKENLPINCGSDSDSPFVQLCKAKNSLDGDIMLRFSKDFNNVDLFVGLEDLSIKT